MPDSVVWMVPCWCRWEQALQTVMFVGCVIDDDLLTEISGMRSFGSFLRVPIILRLWDLDPLMSRQNLRQAAHLSDSGPAFMNLGVGMCHQRDESRQIIAQTNLW